MYDFVTNLAESTWSMLVDSAFLLLVGLALAGLISVYLTSKKFMRFLTGSPRRQVFRAALIGIPLPLCSCSVLPVAHQLRKAGVSKGGTVSFLISTPESGIDSILLTYTLTDPIMTLARPVTAFLTAFAAGHLEAGFEDQRGKTTDNKADFSAAEVSASQCNCEPSESETRKPALSRILSGLKYALTDLLSDLAPYLFFGYVLAGLVSVLLQGDILSFTEGFVSGWGGYLSAIVIGLPLYICATSSTPMAAAMLAGGFTPGAVLVFLMVGPATNAASLVVVSKILKGWSLLRYLLTILVVSLLCGIVVDYAYQIWPQAVWSTESARHVTASWIDLFSAVILASLIIFYSILRLVRRISPS